MWPIILIVASNTMYQICSKSLPQDMDPFASLTITYVMATVVSLVAFFVIGNHSLGIFGELAKTGWSPFVLGIVIVGLEVGYILAYRAGWEVSAASVVQSVILAVALVVVGRLIYGEQVSLTKVAGVAICLVGLYIMNR